MSVEISIVVPVYNSAAILPELTKRIEQTMRAAHLAYEIILVNDHSKDSSWETICQLCKQKKHLKALHLVENKGQWWATLAGMSQAQGKYIVTIDDDLEYEPADIPKLHTTAIQKKRQVVYGMVYEKYRLQGKNPLLSKWRKSLMHKLWNSPPTESFRIIHRDVVFHQHQFLPKVFIDAFIVAHVDWQQVAYEPVASNQRFAGASNVDLKKKIALFLKYRFHFKLPIGWKIALGIAILSLFVVQWKYLPVLVPFTLVGLVGVLIMIWLFKRKHLATLPKLISSIAAIVSSADKLGV